MKHTRSGIFLFCALLALGRTSAQSGWYSLKAFLPGWTGSPVALQIDGKTVYADTLRTEMFSLVDSIEGIHEGLLQLKKENAATFLPLFIEPGTIKVTDKGYRQLTATGTPSNDAYQNLLDRIHQTAIRQYGYDYDQVNAYKANLCMDFITKNPGSLLSLHLLKYYPFLKNPNDPLYTELFESLDPSVKNTFLGNQMATVFFPALAPGKILPNLTLPDSSGTMSTLYTEGKITLVDFWASWCRPCRSENPGLVRVHERFAPNNFTIVSVSLDQVKTQWLQAVRNDRMDWTHLSDGKGWDSPAVTGFHISFIPMNILVDEKGKILAKNLRASELQAFLENYLSQKTGATKIPGEKETR